MSRIHSHTYDNGLTLLAEPMDGVASAGMTLLLPAGVVHEPADRLGVGSVLAEMLFRGAGDRDARQHSDALDRLGVHRSAETTTWNLRIGATMMGDRVEQALPLLLEMARRPHLSDEAFEPSRQLALQSVEGLDDNPQERVMIELKRCHYGEPIGRSVLGQRDHLTAMRNEDVRAFYERTFVPDGAILAVAGNVDFERVREQVGDLLGDWSGRAPEPPEAQPPEPAYHHFEAETAQQHIGLAHRAAAANDPDHMSQQVATAVLSGGMSGRLFTEVREERGLCYAVFATYAAQRHTGAVFAYAGTTTQRAPETLQVIEQELQRLGDGVEREEFDRAIVGLKSRIVMQGESTSARARAIARDQFLRGKPRTLDEMAAEIDAVTLEKLNRFVADHRPERFTTVNIGPEPLTAATTD